MPKKGRRTKDGHSEANSALILKFEGRFCLPESSMISVYRIPPDEADRKKLEFLGNLDMDYLDEALLQQRFGGGSYVLKLLDSRGRWLRQSTVHIANPRSF